MTVIVHKFIDSPYVHPAFLIIKNSYFLKLNQNLLLFLQK